MLSTLKREHRQGRLQISSTRPFLYLCPQQRCSIFATPTPLFFFGAFRDANRIF